MRAIIEQRITRIERGMFEVRIKAFRSDTDASTFFTISKVDENSNIAYSSFRSLWKTINRLSREGIKVVDLQTNVPDVIEELSGTRRKHIRLNEILQASLYEADISFDTITLID